MISTLPYYTQTAPARFGLGTPLHERLFTAAQQEIDALVAEARSVVFEDEADSRTAACDLDIEELLERCETGAIDDLSNLSYTARPQTPHTLFDALNRSARLLSHRARSFGLNRVYTPAPAALPVGSALIDTEHDVADEVSVATYEAVNATYADSGTAPAHLFEDVQANKRFSALRLWLYISRCLARKFMYD